MPRHRRRRHRGQLDGLPGGERRRGTTRGGRKPDGGGAAAVAARPRKGLHGAPFAGPGARPAHLLHRTQIHGDARGVACCGEPRTLRQGGARNRDEQVYAGRSPEKRVRRGTARLPEQGHAYPRTGLQGHSSRCSNRLCGARRRRRAHLPGHLRYQRPDTSRCPRCRPAVPIGRDSGQDSDRRHTRHSNRNSPPDRALDTGGHRPQPHHGSRIRRAERRGGA